MQTDFVKTFTVQVRKLLKTNIEMEKLAFLLWKKFQAVDNKTAKVKYQILKFPLLTTNASERF